MPPKNVGLHHPLKAFDFDKAAAVGLQDASFANDAEVNDSGKASGSRS